MKSNDLTKKIGHLKDLNSLKFGCSKMKYFVIVYYCWHLHIRSTSS